MPTVRQLEYLVTLAQVRHFGRAASACNTSQPTLSHQLRALEKRLGVTLIERRSDGAELTPIGREIAERARRVLVEVEDIRRLARRAGEQLAGTLRFGVTPTLGPYLLPKIVASLHREQPDLRLYIREGIPAEQALELSRGRLDMLLGPLPLEGSDLEVEPLFQERLFIVAPADHPLAAERGLRMSRLAGAAVLSLDKRHHLHAQVSAICSAHDLELLRDYEGTSLDSVRQMVGSGIGLAVLPELYIRSEVGGEGGVRILDISDFRQTRSIAAAWRRGAAYAPEYKLVARSIGREARTVLHLPYEPTMDAPAD